MAKNKDDFSVNFYYLELSTVVYFNFESSYIKMLKYCPEKIFLRDDVSKRLKEKNYNGLK